MSSNPYQPPESRGVRVSRILPRDLGPVTLWTTIVFSLQTVLLLSMGVAALFMGQPSGGDAPSPSPEETLSAPEAFYALSGVGWAILLLPGMVLFLVWIRRANINADALVRSRMEFTPGWAVGWFFVPFANLFKPYQAMAEIYRASDPKADPDYWSLTEVPRYLMLWWLSYLGFNAASNLSSDLFQGREVQLGGGWAAAIVMGEPTVLQCVLGVTASVMVVVVTRSIHRLQEEKARELVSGRPAGSAPFSLIGFH
jgi:hypothetical protein